MPCMSIAAHAQYHLVFASGVSCHAEPGVLMCLMGGSVSHCLVCIAIFIRALSVEYLHISVIACDVAIRLILPSTSQSQPPPEACDLSDRDACSVFPNRTSKGGFNKLQMHCSMVQLHKPYSEL